MAVLTKPQKIVSDSLSTKIAFALWNSFGPKTKRKILVSGLQIVVGAAARKVMKKSGIFLIVGVIVAGAALMANSQDDND